MNGSKANCYASLCSQNKGKRNILHIPPQERQKYSIYETDKISRCLIDKDRLEIMLLAHGEWFSEEQNGEYTGLILVSVHVMNIMSPPNITIIEQIS